MRGYKKKQKTFSSSITGRYQGFSTIHWCRMQLHLPEQLEFDILVTHGLGHKHTNHASTSRGRRHCGGGVINIKHNKQQHPALNDGNKLCPFSNSLQELWT